MLELLRTASDMLSFVSTILACDVLPSCRSGDLRLLSILEQHGILRTFSWDRFDNFENLCDMLYEAAFHGHDDIAEFLVNSRPFVARCYEMLEHLLRKLKDEGTDFGLFTRAWFPPQPHLFEKFLHQSVHRRHLSMFSRILSHIQLDINYHDTERGCVLLEVANIREEGTEFLARLLQGPDLNLFAMDKSGETFLHYNNDIHPCDVKVYDILKDALWRLPQWVNIRNGQNHHAVLQSCITAHLTNLESKKHIKRLVSCTSDRSRLLATLIFAAEWVDHSFGEILLRQKGDLIPDHLHPGKRSWSALQEQIWASKRKLNERRVGRPKWHPPASQPGHCQMAINDREELIAQSLPSYDSDDDPIYEDECILFGERDDVGSGCCVPENTLVVRQKAVGVRRDRRTIGFCRNKLNLQRTIP